MERLTITARLKTSVVLAGGYMTLDGLLASVIFDRMVAGAPADVDPTRFIDAAHVAVPIKNEDGLFFASAAMLDGPRGRRAFVANLRAQHDLDPGLLKKDRTGKATVSLKRRRQYGAVMSTYDTIEAPSIEWSCVGDAEAIEDLLSEVKFLGKRRASGHGEVIDWTVAPGELDGVVGYLNDPLRPVPVEMGEALGIDAGSVKADAAWRPAYWLPQHRSVCFVPAA